MSHVQLNHLGLAELEASSMIAREVQKRLVKVERTAKRLCPVDTGRLRASIAREVHFQLGEGIVGTVGTDVEYAASIELGHRLVAWGRDTGRHIPARPFLRPALQAAAGDGGASTTGSASPLRSRSRSSYLGGLRDDDEGDIG